MLRVAQVPPLFAGLTFVIKPDHFSRKADVSTRDLARLIAWAGGVVEDYQAFRQRFPVACSGRIIHDDDSTVEPVTTAGGRYLVHYTRHPVNTIPRFASTGYIPITATWILDSITKYKVIRRSGTIVPTGSYPSQCPYQFVDTHVRDTLTELSQ